MEADPGSPAESPAAAAAAGGTDSFSQLWSDVMGMLVSFFCLVWSCSHTDLGEGVGQEGKRL